MASSNKEKLTVIANPEIVPKICDSIEDYFTAHFSLILARDRCESLQKFICQAIHQRDFANSVRISLTITPKSVTDEQKKIFDEAKIKLNTAAEFAIVQYNTILEELFKLSSQNLNGNHIGQQKSISEIKGHGSRIQAVQDHFRRICGQSTHISKFCPKFHLVCAREKIARPRQ